MRLPSRGTDTQQRQRSPGSPKIRSSSIVTCAAVVLAAFLAGCEDLPPLPNVPPTASFIFSPVAPIIAGSTAVTFNAAGSRDSDGQLVSYAWDFGDGTPEVAGVESRVVHVFPDTPATCVEVTYSVLLTVRDDAGDPGTASAPVTVIEFPPPEAPECQAPAE